jgi:3-hexulose-6-phosphate synthase
MHAELDAQAEEGFTFANLLRAGEASGVPFPVAGA